MPGRRKWYTFNQVAGNKMVHFLVFSIAIFAGFGLGVWLAPVVRGDYSAFKSYVERFKSEGSK